MQISLASGVAGGVARNGHFLIAPNDLEKKVNNTKTERVRTINSGKTFPFFSFSLESSGTVVAIARTNRSAAFGSAIILASLDTYRAILSSFFSGQFVSILQSRAAFRSPLNASLNSVGNYFKGTLCDDAIIADRYCNFLAIFSHVNSRLKQENG